MSHSYVWEGGQRHICKLHRSAASPPNVSLRRSGEGRAHDSSAKHASELSSAPEATFHDGYSLCPLTRRLLTERMSGWLFVNWTQRGFKALVCKTPVRAPSLPIRFGFRGDFWPVSPIFSLYLQFWACSSDFQEEIRIILLNVSPNHVSGVLQQRVLESTHIICKKREAKNSGSCLGLRRLQEFPMAMSKAGYLERVKDPAANHLYS